MCIRDSIYEDKFDLHENEPGRETHFHVNGFAYCLFYFRHLIENFEHLIKENALIL